MKQEETNGINREDRTESRWVNRLDSFEFPDNLSAEVAVLGSFLLNPDRVNECKHLLKPEDFTEELFQDIYSKICELYFAKVAVDEITLAVELRKMSAFKKINVNLLLCVIMCNVGCSANALYYAKIVAQHSISIQLTGTLSEATQLISDGHLDDVNLDELKEKIALLKNQGVTDLTKSIKEILIEDDGEIYSQIKTGYGNFDRAMGGGIMLGDFSVLGGAPGTGKSQFVINMIAKAKLDEKPVRSLIVVQEMNRATVRNRLLSCLSGIPKDACISIRNGTASQKTLDLYYDRFIKANKIAAQIPIKVHAEGCVNVEQFEAIIAKYINDVDLIVLDYLSQIRKKPKQTNYEKASEVSYACMDTARKHNKCIIALSQFNREGYKDNVRPTMSNLRDCGEIEQDAANVWLMWRDDNNEVEHEETGRTLPVEVELNIAKNRNGPVGNFYFDFNMDCGQITEKVKYY